MAVGGYNTIQEVEVVKTKALDYEPDLLVVGYVHNDNEWGVDGGLWHHFSRSGLYLYDLLRPRLMRLERRFTETITTEAFEELGRLVRKQKLPVLVLIFPLLEEWADGTYPYQSLHDRVANLTKQHGFMVLDLLDPYRKTGFEKLKGQDIIHPNDEGHRIAAAAIIEFLEQKKHNLGLDLFK